VAVEKIYADFASGDVAAVLGAMADGIVWNEAEHFPYADGNPYIGPDAVAEGVFARIGAEWNYWTLDIEDISPSGDTVFARGRYNAQHKESGKTMSAQFVHVWTVKDGAFVRFQQYADTALVRDVMTAD